MEFSDKLNFLIHISQTSNKELALELSVDRSFISLLRNGKRNLRNRQTIRRMAFFFARHCSAEFQRYALSEMLGQVSLRSDMPTAVLAGRLEQWLAGENTLVDALEEDISVPFPDFQTAPFEPSTVRSSGHSEFFYGEEGRREVMRRMMQEIRETEDPDSILIVTDDNLEYLLSDYLLTKQVHAWLTETMERGFSICQILPPMNYINRYTESLRFWLPMYATGQMKVYYYPRIRDNLYRHSIIIVPGRCAQYSSAVQPGSTSDITLFTTDLTLVSALQRQYQQHLSLCRPALNVYHTLEDTISLFRTLFSHYGGNTIQQINALSINTAPAELLERFIREAANPVWEKTLKLHIEEIPHFEQTLALGPFIDMSFLATAAEVRSGTVPVVSAGGGIPLKQLYYTPETYALHLKNIVRLMEQYDNYYFIPCPDSRQDYNLVACENGIAALIHTKEPFVTLEIRRPEMATAFQEHLLRIAERTGYDGVQKKKIRMELRALIRDLES